MSTVLSTLVIVVTMSAPDVTTTAQALPVSMTPLELAAPYVGDNPQAAPRVIVQSEDIWSAQMSEYGALYLQVLAVPMS